MNDFFLILHSQILDPDRFPILLMAMLLTAIAGIITGPMHGNANPFYWKVINGVFGRVGGRLDKQQRESSDLIFRSFLLTVVVLLVSYGLGAFAESSASSVPFYGITRIIRIVIDLDTFSNWITRQYFHHI